MALEYFSEEFVDGMYGNFWQFLNPFVLRDIYNNLTGRQIRLTYVHDVDDDATIQQYPLHYRNTLCYKGDVNDPDAAGHYVYVDHNMVVHGTYEQQLFLDQDDGACHSYALLSALLDANYFGESYLYYDTMDDGELWTSDNVNFDDFTNPQSIQNYYLILSFNYYLLTLSDHAGRFLWMTVASNHWPYVDQRELNAARLRAIQTLENWFEEYEDQLEQDGFIVRFNWD